MKRTLWYWRRMRAMSPREVADRSRRSIFHLIDATTFHVRPVWRARWEPANLVVREPLSSPVGFITDERAAGLRYRLPSDAAALVARADSAHDGRVRLFGYPEVVVPASGAEVDPFSGRAWPSRHAKRIDYRSTAPGDPKVIWEINRCQEFPVLAAAWLVSGEPRYGQAASDRMESWIKAHPPGRGIVWSSGFEAGIRAISLATTLDALRGSEFLTPERQSRALLSLWQHAKWIERDPAVGSSANNHRLGELVGLLVIAALAPELRNSEERLADALERLELEADRQIRSDGTGVEQAFAYHIFGIDLLLVAAAVLDATKRPVPTAILRALERSAHALWAQLGDGEPPPTYGDTDDGRALILDASDLRDARAAAASIGALLGDAKAVRVMSDPDPLTWWLFGANGADRLARTERAPEAGSIVLPDGGLTILRAGKRRTIVDHGPHGYLSLAAHAHADALGIDLSYGEHRLVVDPGVGGYFAHPPRREAFRGTGFHASVVIDECDSSESGGAFLWTRHAIARVLTQDCSRGIIVAEHDGYSRLEDPVSHRRAVLDLEGAECLLVLDRLEGRGEHRFSQRWPLAPELEIEEHTDDRAVARGNGVQLLLAVAATTPFSLRAVKGQREPFQGWWSERLESIEPSWLLAVDVQAIGAVEIATVLAPFPQDSPVPAVDVSLKPAGASTKLDLTTADGAWEIEVDLASPTPRLTRCTAASVV